MIALDGLSQLWFLFFFPALCVASVPCHQYLREIHLLPLPPDFMMNGRVEDTLLKHVGESVTAFLSIPKWKHLKHSQVSVKISGVLKRKAKCPNTDLGEYRRLSLLLTISVIIVLLSLTAMFHSSGIPFERM